MRTTSSLNGPWTVFVERDGRGTAFTEMSALERSGLARAEVSVPGTVEDALQQLGELPEELYRGAAVLASRRVENYGYFFARRFEVSAAERGARSLRLVFDGVDTLATYFVNGRHVGSSANMLVPIELEVGGALRAGTNEVVVRIDPPCARPSEALDLYEGSPHSYREESVALRKAPHMYGWDIMPRLLSGGLWRGARLEARTGPVLEDWVVVAPGPLAGAAEARLRLLTSVSGIPGLLGGHLPEALHRPGGPAVLTLDASCAGRRIEVEVPLLAPSQAHDFNVPGPALWWPRGYGEPACYRGRLTLAQDGAVLDEVAVSFGLRTVELDRRAPEGAGTQGFAFVLNGERVFCYGPNWVPLDARHAADAGLYRSRLDLLERSGANMVRCWGGNVYEDEAFFEATDATGIMVWQDMAMACAAYPQDDDFARGLRHEVRTLAKRLRRHPSLVLWCGDNEVDLINVGRGLDPDANVLTREVLPRALARLDPFRPYHPSSPYISAGAVASGDLERHGDAHLWGPRDAFWSDFYRSSQAPFVSEIGFMGLPEHRSLEEMFGDDGPSWWPPRDTRWLVHATDPTMDWGSSFWARTAKTFDRAAQYVDLGTPFEEAPVDDVVLASQLAQAEGFKYVIERARHARSPERSGLLWWNLVDGWPQVSDAVVDYYGRKKLAYAFIARVQTPLLLSVMEEPPAGERGDGAQQDPSTPLRHALVAVNHSRRTRAGEARVTLAQTEGPASPLWEGSFELPPGGHLQVAELSLPPARQGLVLLDVDSDGEHLANHAIVGKPPFTLADWRAWLPKIFQESPDAVPAWALTPDVIPP